MKIKFYLFLIFAVFSNLVSLKEARCEDFSVNSFKDAVDNNLNINNLKCATNLEGNPCTLRAAIQNTNKNNQDDTIILSEGTYLITVDGDSENDSANKDLDVKSDNNHKLIIKGVGPDKTIVDGNALDRVFHVVGASTSVTLSNLTVKGGSKQSDGGGIFNEGTLSLENCVITDNHALFANDNTLGFGGGIYNVGNLVIDHSSVSYNTANAKGNFAGGGGIYSEKGSHIIIRDSLIAQNQAKESGNSGGGIFLYGAVALIERTMISDNKAYDSGSGIASRADPGTNTASELVIKSSSIFGNIPISQTGVGGGVYDSNGLLELENTTISGNQANYGGAIYKYDDYDANNIKPGLVFRNITITQNKSYNRGGGIYIYNDILNNPENYKIKNTIIAKNSSDKYPTDYPDCYFPFTVQSEGYNIVGIVSPFACAIIPDEGDHFGSKASPIDPLLGILQDNGGPTSTHELLSDSIAIDRGSPDGCPGLDGNPLLVDQRGSKRPQGQACDIGAVESGCGNGQVQVGEECDDGNTIGGDGCSSECKIETDPGSGTTTGDSSSTSTDTGTAAATATGGDSGSAGASPDAGGGCSLSNAHSIHFSLGLACLWTLLFLGRVITKKHH